MDKTGLVDKTGGFSKTTNLPPSSRIKHVFYVRNVIFQLISRRHLQIESYRLKRPVFLKNGRRFMK